MKFSYIVEIGGDIIMESYTLNQYIITKNDNNTLKLDIYRKAELNGVSIYDNEIEAIMWIMQQYFFMGDLTVEYIYVVAYDVNNWLKGIYLVSIGDDNHVKSFPREIMTFLMLINAESFLLVHNHPNNGLGISRSDEEQYEYFYKLSEMIKINFKGSYAMTKDGWINVLTKERNYFVDLEEKEE